MFEWPQGLLTQLPWNQNVPPAMAGRMQTISHYLGEKITGVLAHLDLLYCTFFILIFVRTRM